MAVSLLSLIRDEANLLWSISKEFADIQKELDYIQSSLEKADRMASEEGDNTTKGVKAWVKELREASFRIEDVIDEYMIFVEQQPHDDAFGCVNFLFECNITHFIESLKRRHQIASEIQQIKSFVQGIKQKGIDYDYLIKPSLEKGSSSYRGSQSVQWHDPRKHSRYLEEAEVVGLEGQRDKLIGWLVEGPSERTVISVVGMGGLGKTTLAGRVFNNQKVTAHFECCAWITVSKTYTEEGVLGKLLKKLYEEDKQEKAPQGIDEMDRDSLIHKVRKYLQPKRYFVIFDDVWSIELWGQIQNAMLDNKKGSRVFITTRMDGVVDSCMISPFDMVHKLKPLTKEESMELFCKKAFPCHNNGNCPEDFKKISSDFVEKCKGLPLAIVAIGSLLSGKTQTPFEWEKIRRSLSSEMDKNPHLIGITKILGFSYDDLSYHLKPCLLYFGAYPEDYEVNSKRLIWQWVAEGFVREEEGKTLEDTAQQYFSELIGRGLVQVSSFTIDGKAKSCRVHDLLHDMLLKKSKDLSFCQHIIKEDESMSSGMIRRLSIETISNDLLGRNESLHTRSLLVFAEELCTTNFLEIIPTKYRLLKVLDFKDILLYSVSVPENLGNLAHLKYLNLRSSKMPTQLPEFICKLHNLETLDIRDTDVEEIPKEICKLRKLRHLLGDYITLFQLNGLGGMASLQTLRHVKLTMTNDDGDNDNDNDNDNNDQEVEGDYITLFQLNGLGGMASLQTLRRVKLTMTNDDGDNDNNDKEVEGIMLIKEDVEVELIRELGKLKQLRNLSLTSVKEEQGSALCSSLNEMANLEKLRIETTAGGVIDLPIISPLPMLQKLRLDGKLKKFPEWVPQLQSLVKLSLRSSQLTIDPLKSLQNMPHLLFLEMLDAYEGESLYFENGGFHQLKELSLGFFPNLKSIIIDKGALYSLEKLKIWKIMEIKTVPPGIQHLEKLQVLVIDHMSDELINECITPNEGPQHPIIQHVPLVKVTVGDYEQGIKTHIIHHSRH
ncbi:Disease resistance protein RPM1 [Glycine soja]|nr:Disease resistance protein RPM1 [Glycine soja]